MTDRQRAWARARKLSKLADVPPMVAWQFLGHNPDSAKLFDGDIVRKGKKVQAVIASVRAAKASGDSGENGTAEVGGTSRPQRRRRRRGATANRRGRRQKAAANGHVNSATFGSLKQFRDLVAESGGLEKVKEGIEQLEALQLT